MSKTKGRRDIAPRKKRSDRDSFNALGRKRKKTSHCETAKKKVSDCSKGENAYWVRKGGGGNREWLIGGEEVDGEQGLEEGGGDLGWA